MSIVHKQETFWMMWHLCAILSHKSHNTIGFAEITVWVKQRYIGGLASDKSLATVDCEVTATSAAVTLRPSRTGFRTTAGVRYRDNDFSRYTASCRRFLTCREGTFDENRFVFRFQVFLTVAVNFRTKSDGFYTHRLVSRCSWFTHDCWMPKYYGMQI